MHTLLDLRGGIPANIHITDGKWHDSNELDELTPEPCTLYVMDKAYVDFKALFRFHQAQALWVSRPKENMKFKTIEQMDITDAKTGILEDSRIKVTGYKSSKLYPEDMRFVIEYAPDNDTIIQVDQTEYCREKPLGLFRKCCQSPPLGCPHILSDSCKNKGRIQQPLFHY